MSFTAAGSLVPKKTNCLDTGSYVAPLMSDKLEPISVAALSIRTPPKLEIEFRSENFGKLSK